MVKPIDRAILQISQWVVARGAREFVFSDDSLFFPGLGLVGWPCRRPAVDPITPPHRLPPISPAGNSTRVDDLSFDVETADEELVAGIAEILKHRAAILTHQHSMGGIVMDAKLIAHSISIADAVQFNPRAWGIRNVVMPSIGGVPSGHRTLLDSISQSTRLGLLQ